MNVERFMTRRFDAERYNCWSFVVDVWHELTGQSLPLAPSDVRTVAAKQQLAALWGRTQYEELPRRQSPCLVLMIRSEREEPHIGIFYQGRVLHMDRQGARYELEATATRYFAQVRYYKPHVYRDDQLQPTRPAGVEAARR